jgi:hypothetical protein
MLLHKVLNESQSALYISNLSFQLMCFELTARYEVRADDFVTNNNF